MTNGIPALVVRGPTGNLNREIIWDIGVRIITLTASYCSMAFRLGATLANRAARSSMSAWNWLLSLSRSLLLLAAVCSRRKLL